MNIIIQTLGQRDVQIFVKNNQYNFASFKKAELKVIQAELKRLMNSNLLKWRAVYGIEGKQDITLDQISEGSYEVCFPLIEKSLNYLKSLNNTSEIEFVLLYTNRQHLQNNRFSEAEPHFFSEIILNFWKQVTDYYQLNINLRLINICESMTGNADIDVDFAYLQMDKIISNFFNEYSDVNKIIVFNAGGIPRLSQALELSLNAYFPKLVDFLEHKNNEVIKSRQYLLNKRYSLKFAILQNIKNYNFSEAYKNALDLQLNTKDKQLYQLLSIPHLWLYEENKKAMDTISEYITIYKPSLELENMLRKMREMLKPENTMGCNLIRAIQETRQENYWGMCTVLISAVELFILEYLRSYYPDTIVNYDQRVWFDLLKFPFIDTLPSDNQSVCRSNPKLFMANWSIFFYIIEKGLQSDKRVIFETLKELMLSINGLKKTRNAFIHEGLSIPKSVINQCLKYESSMKMHNENMNSLTFKFLIAEAKKMKHLVFINWMPIYQKELISLLIKMSPID